LARMERPSNPVTQTALRSAPRASSLRSGNVRHLTFWALAPGGACSGCAAGFLSLSFCAPNVQWVISERDRVRRGLALGLNTDARRGVLLGQAAGDFVKEWCTPIRTSRQKASGRPGEEPWPDKRHEKALWRGEPVRWLIGRGSCSGQDDRLRGLSALIGKVLGLKNRDQHAFKRVCGSDLGGLSVCFLLAGGCANGMGC